MDNSTSTSSCALDTFSFEFDRIEERLGLKALLQQQACALGFTRARCVPSFLALFRLLIAYALSSLSSRAVSSWAVATGLFGALSHVTLLALMTRSAPWLRSITNTLLERYNRTFPIPTIPDSTWKLVALDATCITSRYKGCHQFERMHLLFDVFTGALRQVRCDLEQRTGEKLSHFALEKDWLVLADRCYCSLASFEHAASQGAHLLVRWSRNVGLYQPVRGRPAWDWKEALGHLEQGDEMSGFFWLGRGPRARKVWVHARHMGADFQAEEIQRLKHNKQKLTPETREMARYMIVVTDLSPSELCGLSALEYYHLRWTGTEINIREAKSEQGLGRMPRKSGKGARAWLWAHVCGQVIAQWMAQPAKTSDPPVARKRASYQAVVKQLTVKMVADAMLPIGLSLWLEHGDAFCAHYPEDSRQRGSRPHSTTVFLDKLLPSFRLQT